MKTINLGGLIKLKNNGSKKTIKLSLLFLILICGIAAFYIFRSPGVKPVANKKVQQGLNQKFAEAMLNKQEADQFVTRILEDCNPELPQNQHFTKFMKDKLSEFFLLNKQGKFGLQVFNELDKNSTTTIMTVVYDKGNPTVVVFVPKIIMTLLLDYDINYKRNQTYPTEFKNTIATALVHELVHCENEVLAKKPQWTVEETLAEESRVWLKVNREITRPFRKVNQPLHPNVIKFDDIAIQCSDNANCQEMISFITGNSSINK